MSFKGRAILLAVALLIFSAHAGFTAPEYAEQAGKTCAFCHAGANGGLLKTTGIAFIRNGYNYPIPERVLDKSIALSSGFHKILLFVIMAVLGVLAVTIISSKMREQLRKGISRIGTSGQLLGHSGDAPRRSAGPGFTQGRRSTPAALGLKDLSSFDGNEGRPPYVLFRNKVYDLSDSSKWQGGAHFRAHVAGEDLTKKIESAPHGEEVLERFPVVAELSEISRDLPADAGKPKGARKTYIVLSLCQSDSGVSHPLLCGRLALGFSLRRPRISAPVRAETAGSRLAGISREHFQYDPTPVSGFVSPQRWSIRSKAPGPTWGWAGKIRTEPWAAAPAATPATASPWGRRENPRLATSATSVRTIATGELSADSYFDEELEWEFYEFWHHEGRRARMGAAMMAQDYAWWHGFCELKHRFVKLMELARAHSRKDKAEWLEDFPGRRFYAGRGLNKLPRPR